MSATSRSSLVLIVLAAVVRPGRADDLPPGWTARSPRDEIRPAFAYDPAGGPTRAGAFVITHDQRAGLQGWVEKEFPVTGGEWVRFRVVRRTPFQHSGIRSLEFT